MESKEYWRRRSKQRAAELERQCVEEIEPELARYFKESLKELEKEIAYWYSKYAREGGMSYHEAQKAIRGEEFKEWRMTLEEYIALSHTNSKILRELNTLSRRARISRLEKLYTETLMQLQRLGEKYEGTVKEFLTAAYKERYYHSLYDLGKVGKVEIPLSKVEPSKLEKVLAMKWQGGNYSSRIWKDTEKLSRELKSRITQGLHRGLSVKKLSTSLSKEMSVSYKNAERLVRTELNFVSNYAAKESMEAAGLEEYEFIAVLDNRTTVRCQSLDGTLHLLEEYEVGTNAPPMHPRCRSTISAVVEGGKRVAKAGKNVRVPANWSYEKWRKTVESGKIENKGVTAKGWLKKSTLTTPIMNVSATKTFEEFKTYWAENYNVKVSDEIKKVDLKAVKTAAQGIELVLSEFPVAAVLLKEFRIYEDDTIMNTSYRGQIGFNPKYFNDLEELRVMAIRDEASGFRPKKTGIKGYGTHEAGHILELALIQKHGGNIEDWKNSTYARRIVRRAYNSPNINKNIYELRREISQYASDKSLGETLAESVADYIANKDKAALLSQAIWKVLKEELVEND